MNPKLLKCKFERVEPIIKAADELFSERELKTKAALNLKIREIKPEFDVYQAEKLFDEAKQIKLLIGKHWHSHTFVYRLTGDRK